MLFGFRGIRVYQTILAIGAGACGVGVALVLKAFADNGNALWFAPAILLGLAFIVLFSAALRAPTSFVAVNLENGLTRIRVPPFVDTVIANSEIASVSVVELGWWWGLGMRMNFGGEVFLLTSPGVAARIELKQSIRVWAIPRLIPVRCNVLSLSIRNPALLAERFGGDATVKAG